MYDLSSLTAAQAEALLQAHGEQLCVRFYRRADGTILTADCPVGARKRKVRLAVIAGATALATAVGTAAGALGLVMDEPRPTCTVRDRHGVGVNGDHDPSPYVPTRNVGAEHHLEPVQGGASLVMGQAIAAE